MSKEIRIGIVGTGSICHMAHIPSIKRIPGIKIVALCDIDPEALKHTMEVLNDPSIQTFNNHKDMLNLPLDVVHVCTPNYAHSPITVDFLNNGISVFCEKPIAKTAEEGEAMLKAEKNSKAKFSVAHCWRYNNEVIALKKLIEAGHLGEIYFSKVQALRRRGIPNWGVFCDLEKQGGGPLIDIGCHSLDAALYLMGNPKPISVTGSTYRKIGDKPNKASIGPMWDWENYSIEDFASGFVKFENGMSMFIEAAFAAHIENDKASVTLLGTEGGAQTQPLKLFSEAEGYLTNITPAYMPNTDVYYEETVDFYNSIKNDLPIPIKGWQAQDVMKIISGIYKSAQTGKTIEI